VAGLEEEARADFDIEFDLYAAVLALHPCPLRRCQATRSGVADDHERSM